jgi:hypothetical protein
MMQQTPIFLFNHRKGNLMNTIEERKINPIEEMTRIAVDVLDVDTWGFKESYQSITAHPRLIFDSDRCRISFVWGGWDTSVGNSIHIRYGRLHASNEKVTLVWNGEECRCWHDFDYVLHFLDGQTPMDAARLDYSHSITDPFYEEEFRHKFHRRQPEWLAHMHATIWRHYGKRFFELFDLRRPDLWEKYRQFLKEAYDIKGRSPRIKPPLDKVC